MTMPACQRFPTSRSRPIERGVPCVEEFPLNCATARFGWNASTTVNRRLTTLRLLGDLPSCRCEGRSPSARDLSTTPTRPGSAHGRQFNARDHMPGPDDQRRPPDHTIPPASFLGALTPEGHAEIGRPCGGRAPQIVADAKEKVSGDISSLKWRVVGRCKPSPS